MTPSALTRALAWISLGAAGFLSHLVFFDALDQPSVAPDLSRLPARLGDLERVEEVVFDPTELGDAPPDRYHFARYRSADGKEGLLYVAYFLRGKRWSGRPHPVDACFTSQGWKVEEGRLLHSPGGASIWRHHFRRADERIAVVHWLQRPGELPVMGLVGGLRARLTRLTNLRQDVASVYWEFPVDARPSDETFLQASAELIGALDALWR